VVLINNEESAEGEIPNANVNMEYGLMLGFNKYVIPFQRASQTLPFNVAGLDTIKYSNENFERLAGIAIEQAIRETQQDEAQPLPADQGIGTFLLTKKAIVTPINTPGDRDIFQLGSPLGFNLLNDFTGMQYMFLGNFTAFRPEVVVWRIKMLTEILNERRTSLSQRVKAGIISAVQSQFEGILGRLQIWIFVTSDADKISVEAALSGTVYSVEVFSLDNVRAELESLGQIGA
jgi:hypothetical protein